MVVDIAALLPGSAVFIVRRTSEEKWIEYAAHNDKAARRTLSAESLKKSA
jgi:hypothetical protein